MGGFEYFQIRGYLFLVRIESHLCMILKKAIVYDFSKKLLSLKQFGNELTDDEWRDLDFQTRRHIPMFSLEKNTSFMFTELERFLKTVVYLYAKQFSIGFRIKLNLNCSHITISTVQATSPELMLQTIACRDENHQHLKRKRNLYITFWDRKLELTLWLCGRRAQSTSLITN